MSRSSPPHIADAVLAWYCDPDLLEDIQGDLHELYYNRVSQMGRRKAAAHYWWDVLRFLRLYNFRRAASHPVASSAPIMLNNYVKVSLRNLRRRAGYSLINVLGLAVGLAVCMLTLLYVDHETSYDRFHANADRIARIHMTWVFGDTDIEVPQTTTAPGPVFHSTLPYVENYVRFRRKSEAIVQVGDKLWKESDFVFADSTMFDVFSFELAHGHAEQALRSPGHVVLSKDAARRYFGTVDAVGKTLLVDGEDYVVGGVLHEIPDNSHIRFGLAASFESLPEADKQAFDRSSYLTYVLLSDDASFSKLQTDANHYLVERFGAANQNRPLLHVMPFQDVYLHSDVGTGWPVGGDYRYVALFSAIAVLILVIACINYMNLATARSADRAREVGMRKVLGARTSEVFSQFMGEALLITLLSIGVSLLLAAATLPWFNGLTGQSHLPEALLRPGTLLAAWGVISLLAGGYPALVLSNLRPMRILKGQFRNSMSGIVLRKGLVIFQFGITFILIAGTLTIDRQLDFMRNKELGFDREQIVTIPIKSESAERSRTLRAAFADLSHVEGVAGAQYAPSMGSSGRTFKPHGQDDNRQLVATIDIDESYVDVMGIELLAGRTPTFGEVTGSDRQDAVRKILLNREAADLFGWTPEEAVGKMMFSASLDSDVEVIGVVANFHFLSLHQPIKPLVLTAGKSVRYVIVRTAGTDIPGTMEQLEKTYDRLIPDKPFEYQFLDATFDALYDDEQQMATLFSLFSGLAIFIACLGLLGLAAFTVVQKTREIGIRKVLGASPLSIASLVAREFVILVVIALVMATPLAYIAMQRWLEGFAYRVDASFWTFAAAGILAIVISLATVSYQSVKASMLNPVTSLGPE